MFRSPVPYAVGANRVRKNKNKNFVWQEREQTLRDEAVALIW
jgi:hypothetical protein